MLIVPALVFLLSAQDVPPTSVDAAPAKQVSSTRPVIPLEELRRAAETDLRRAASELQAMPARPISELLELRLDDRGLIEARVLCGDTDGIKRLDASDVGGLVNINASPGSPQDGRPSFVDFQHVDFAPPHAIMNAMQVFSRGDYLQIAWDQTGVVNTSRMQLIQAPQMSDDPKQNLRVYYDLFDGITDQHLDRRALAAENLPAMLRDHRDDTLNLVIHPLKRRGLHAQLLAVPAPQAWQALPDAIDPSPQTRAEVERLVRRLDSEAFRDRESAAAELRQMGAPAAMVLRDMDRSTLSEEQRQAIETITAQFAPMPAHLVENLADDPLFLLGCLYGASPEVWPVAARRLSERLGEPVSIGDSEADRLTEADRLLQRHFLDPAARRATTRPMNRTGS